MALYNLSCFLFERFGASYFRIANTFDERLFAFGSKFVFELAITNADIFLLHSFVPAMIYFVLRFIQKRTQEEAAIGTLFLGANVNSILWEIQKTLPFFVILHCYVSLFSGNLHIFKY